MKECIFCKICSGEIPAALIHESESLIAFDDIRPKAPVHILIVPRKHIASINETEDNDNSLLAEMIFTAKNIAALKGIDEKGYRLVFNIRHDGGQEVNHIHLHLLGGKKLSSMA